MRFVLPQDPDYEEIGAGKSVISAAIIESYTSAQQLNATTEVFLYFFFRNGDIRTEGVAAMVASLIEQLFRTGIYRKGLFEILENSYDDYGASPCDSMDRLWEILRKMLSAFPAQVVILLDALDECSQRDSIFDHIDSVKARFLITSRPEPDICTAVEKSSNVHIVEMDVRKDIEQFMTTEIEAGSPLEPFKDLIMNKIMETSDGMFRYATLMMEELNTPSHLDIPEVLNSLPNGLNDMYARALQRLPENLRALRQTTLMYVSCAHRPVTVEEVIFAHAVKPGEQDFDPQQKALATKEKLLESCGSLVEVFMYSLPEYKLVQTSGKYKSDETYQTEALRFSHLTIKDFLLRDSKVISAMGIGDNTKCEPETDLQISMARITSKY